MQNAYLKAFQNLVSLKDPESFPEWLGQSFKNEEDRDGEIFDAFDAQNQEPP